MGKKQSGEEKEHISYTINSFREKLVSEYKTKRNGEFFKDQDIYQYIYRRQVPKIYGGETINLQSESGIIQFTLSGDKSSYLERRGRRKGSLDSYKRQPYPKKI